MSTPNLWPAGLFPNAISFLIQENRGGIISKYGHLSRQILDESLTPCRVACRGRGHRHALAPSSFVDFLSNMTTFVPAAWNICKSFP